MNGHIRKVLLALVALQMYQAQALTYYSRASGNWNDPTRWSLVGYGGAAAPTCPGQTGAGDVVFISGHTITGNITPAFNLGAITLNHLGTAATTKLDLNTADITLTCAGVTLVDNNVDHPIELEVSSTATLQVNGAIQCTRSSGNNRNKNLRVYVRTNGRINTTGNFTFTYNRAGGETGTEIQLDNSGRLDVGGNLTCTVGFNGGGNSQFTLQLNNTPQLNVAGNASFTVQTSNDGDDMNIDQNGGTVNVTGSTTWRVASTATSSSAMYVLIDGGTWNTNGGLTMDQQDGDTYNVRLNSTSTAAAAALNVTGNATLSHTDGDDQTIELNNNATFAISGNLTCTFSENDDVDQFFDIDGGTFSTGNNLIATVTGTGSDHELTIEVDGTGVFSVGNDLTINPQEGDDLEIVLNSNAGTGAQMSVGRDMIIDKDPDSDAAYMDLHESSVLTVGRDLIIRHSPDGDDELWLGLYDTPTLTVGGNMELSMDDGNDDGDDLGIDQDGGTIQVAGNFSMTRSNGDDFYWDQDGGTATVDGDYTVTSTNGEAIEITLDGSAQLTVAGQMTLNLVDSDDALLTLNENNGNGALLTIGADLYIDHTGTADDVEVLMNNSALLSTGGDFRWDHNAANGDYARVRLSDDAAGMNIAGDLTLGLLSGTDADDDLDYDQQGGTVTIGGSATFAHAGGDDLYAHVHNNSTFYVTGDLDFNHTGGDDFKFDQSSNNSWVYVDGDVNMTDANGGNTPTEFEQDNFSNSRILGDLNITANGGGQCLVDMNNSAYMEIGGSFVRGGAPNRFGSLTSSNGTTIEYDGVGNTQFLSEDAGDGGDGWDYENVVINNTFATYPQLSTVGTTTINQSLTLTDGVIHTEGTSLLVIANGSTSSAGSDASFVDGPMKRIGSGNFTFPVGDDQVWARLGTENLANANGGTEWVCEYFFQPAPNNSVPNYGAGITHVSFVEHWSLDRVADPGNNATCRARLYWEDSDRSGIAPANVADLRVARFSTTWQNQGGTATGGASGNILSGSTISTFGYFSFGSGGGGNPLPIELLDFDARAIGSTVELTWSTATETNNERFEVERSADGLSFTTILSQPGAGNSTSELHYADVDPDPLHGVNYYRLKQIDFDGAFGYSNIIAVQVAHSEVPNPVVYPNPGNSELYIALPVQSEGLVNVALLDVSGRSVQAEAMTLAAGAVLSLATDGLPAGSYTVRLQQGEQLLGSARWLKVD